MGEFLYRSINKIPSGEVKVDYTTDPSYAEKLGGLLTCRLVEKFNPISKLNLGFKGKTSTNNFPPPIR